MALTLPHLVRSVNEQHAVEMVHFVLDHAGVETLEVEGLLFAAKILEGYGEGFVARREAPLARKA